MNVCKKIKGKFKNILHINKIIVNICFLVVNVEEGSCSQFKNFQTLE